MPAPWALLALGALATLSAYSVSMKWLLREEEATDPVLLSSVVFLLVGGAATGLWLLVGEPAAELARLTAGRTPALCALDVALYTLAPILYFHALKALPVSQVAVLHGMTGVFTMAGGALLGLEALSGLRLAGAGLILAAIGLVSGPGAPWRIGRPALRLLGATALYGAAALVDQRLIAASGLSTLTLLSVAFLPPGAALLLVGLARVPGARATLGRLLRRRALLGGAAALAASYLCVYRAYGVGGPASGVTLVLAAEAVVVVVLAAALLRERERLGRKLAAGLVVALGVTLVG